MKRPPEEIRTERLILHKHRLEEAKQHFEVVNRERERLGKWMPWVEKTQTTEDTFRNMEISHTDWENRSLFDYTLKTTEGEFIGRLGMHRLDWSIPRAEVGYWLKEKAEGKGYLNEAIQALEKEFFKLGFERLEIRCDPLNVRSFKVAQKLGYKLEGILEKNIRCNNQLRDTMVWAKLKRTHKNRELKRPIFIGHWSDFFSAEEWSYPGSTEKMGKSSPIGKKLGLEKIGIHYELLEPGRRTSWPHAEKDEEEFVYVIEGNPDVWIDGVLYPLSPGDFVAFPSGTGIAHTFINNTGITCKLLAGGEASRPGNKIHYPLHPKRNEEMKAQDRWWEDAPSTELGLHDGLPYKIST